VLLDLVRLTPIWDENHCSLRGRLSRPVHGRIAQCCKGVSLLKKQCSVKALRSRPRHARVMCGTTMSTHARAALPCEHRIYTGASFAHVCHHCVAPTRELRVAHDQALAARLLTSPLPRHLLEVSPGPPSFYRSRSCSNELREMSKQMVTLNRLSAVSRDVPVTVAINGAAPEHVRGAWVGHG